MDSGGKTVSSNFVIDLFLNNNVINVMKINEYIWFSFAAIIYSMEIFLILFYGFVFGFSVLQNILESKWIISYIPGPHFNRRVQVKIAISSYPFVPLKSRVPLVLYRIYGNTGLMPPQGLCDSSHFCGAFAVSHGNTLEILPPAPLKRYALCTGTF